MEGVPMLLCTILQRLHLEADAVGSVSVSKVYLSSFQTLLKHTTLYTCNIMIHLWFFFPSTSFISFMEGSNLSLTLIRRELHAS